MQQALVIPEKFGPFTLDPEYPIPEPGKNEILVKAKAVALNPGDWIVQKYGVLLEVFPAIVGMDIAGEVVKVSEGVEKFKIGDRVFFKGDVTPKEHAGFQQFVVVDAPTAALIPDNFSYDEAATLPTALTTAYLGFYGGIPRGLGLKSFLTNPGLYSGKAFFVSGGSSSMGQAAIQTAKLSGFTYIVATASLKHAEYLKSLGATHVFDRNLGPQALKTALAEIDGLPKIEYAYDAVGVADSSLKLALAAVSPGGTVVTVNPMIQYDESAPENEGKILCKFAGVKKDPEGLNVPLVGKLWENATVLLENGFKGQRFEVLPGGLNGVIDGLARLENGQVSGIKLVVHPNETE